MEIWKLALLFFSALLGGICIFLFKKSSTQELKLILSLSGAYLFSITVLHLMPEVYREGGYHIGLFILGGFLLQILMEQFSEGIEHGHVHLHHGQRFPFGMMVSLCLHAFLEGMPLGQGQHNDLVFGISLHHIPAAFALGSVLLRSKIKKSAVFVLLALFAMMCPLGYWFSYLVGHGRVIGISNYYASIMGIVIGIFLHISTTILFESSVDHKFNTKKLIAVCIGITVALIGEFIV